MTDASTWPITIVESPYAGDIARNEVYVKAACADCMKRGEVPFASHLFFTRFLNDADPQEREAGMTAGYAFWRGARKIAFYRDLGVSPGMERALKRAQTAGLEIEHRYLYAQEPKP